MQIIAAGKAYVQAGRGWVNDPNPAAEFQEIENQRKTIYPPQCSAPEDEGATLWRGRAVARFDARGHTK